MQGSGLGHIQQKEGRSLFDEFERFRAIGNEYQFILRWRFHKLPLNGMKITQLNIQNSSDEHPSFVNNLPGLSGCKYVNNVKQEQWDISTTLMFRSKLISSLIEPHAEKTLKKQEQSTLYCARGKDRRWYVTMTEEKGHVARQCRRTQEKMDSRTDTTNMFQSLSRGCIMTQDVDEGPNVLSNQEMAPRRHLVSMLRSEIVGQYDSFICILLDNEGQNFPTGYHADKSEQALVIQRNKRNAELVQENDLLKSTLSGKEKSIAFLQSEKEKILSEKKDLADSYLDEIVCLKNANKVARDILQRFNMPTETIPMLFKKPKMATADLHKDILGTRNPGLGYMAKRAQPVLYDADTLLHPNHHPVSIWDSEEVLVHQVVSMKKMNEKPGHVRPANDFYAKLNALMFVPQKELSGDQAYWLSANEIASQASKPVKPATPFVHKSRPPSQVLASLRKVNAVFPQFEGIIKERTTQKPDYVSEWCFDYAKQFVEQQLVPFYDHFKKHIQVANDTFFKEIKEFEQIFDELEAEYEQCVLDNKNLTIEKKNLLIKNDCLIAECLEKDICSIVFTSDSVVPPSSNCLCEDLRSACDREHTKVLELEAEISKQKQLISESEKRFAFLEQNYVSLQLKFQNYKQCIDTSSASNAIFEINKLRQQLQGKDDTIRNLDAQINIMKVLNVGTTEGSCDQQALETDRIQLKDTITSLRIQLDGLKVENVSLKRRYDELSKANTHSRTAYTEKLSAFTAENTKLKAQVTGMYNLGSKYIPPPKRANWVKPTPVPKKKQVTFSEPPRPSLKPTQKPVVHPNKQTNVCVPMSTGVKPTSGASKTNRVDSNLLVKHSVSVSKLNNVCAACNKSLVFANHNDCLIMCDDSVNVKPHQTKRLKRQPKKEWKPIKNVGKPIKRVWKSISKPVASSKPQWKPTGRHFSLFEKYPLTRIMEPTDMQIELPPSASSSPKITMVSRASYPRKVCVSQAQQQPNLVVQFCDGGLEDAYPTAFSHIPLRYGDLLKALSRSALVKDPNPLVSLPTKKQDRRFCCQWFDDDEVVPIPLVVPTTPVNVPAAPAPENANGSPSTTVISEGAPAVTENLLPHQIPLPDTSDSDDETLFDHVDSNVFDTYNAPETDSEASSSNSVNIDVTPNNQLPHVQKWTQAHPLENIIGDKDRPVSTRKQLETDAMWCFFNEFLTHVEPKTYKQALEHSCWIEAMQEEIHEFERLDVWILVPCPDNILIIPLKWIFKIKLDEYGDVLKNKARLVAKGYRQEAGIDFEESFAPVARRTLGN
ncbi:copia protein [Tanacetum coccineum]|uniref:Copia protein n=1 Tax=Tanacetum coccineum TaxID=301880 RepID=A0ABQ5DRE4_9ASTR